MQKKKVKKMTMEELIAKKKAMEILMSPPNLEEVKENGQQEENNSK